MKELTVQKIATKDIDEGQRLRPVDPAHVALLAQSIREHNGLIQPIEVRQVGDAYRLVSGAHRLAAFKVLEWEEIPAVVRRMKDNNEARLREIDENLVRHELNPLDRAMFLAERKRIYDEQHPETKHGGDRKSAVFKRKNQSAKVATWSFTDDTAERTELGKTTIRRLLDIANNLQPDVRARLAGTRFARKQADLLALAKLGPTEQRAAVDALLADDATGDSVRKTVNKVTGRTSRVKDGEQKLFHAWGRARKHERRRFCDGVPQPDALFMAQELRKRLSREEWAALLDLPSTEAPPPVPVDPAAEEAARTAAALAEAQAAGEYAGKNGRKQTDSPYDLYSREGQTWFAAWEKGRDSATERTAAA